ncbi:MAG: hypothetical protein IJS01_10445 [Lentisphaeria bacterium]|nr:hypothetical protein [Lentisphaeria bacterium]
MRKLFPVFALFVSGSLGAGVLELSDGRAKLLFADAGGNYAFQSVTTGKGVRFGFRPAAMWVLSMAKSGDGTVKKYTADSPAVKSHRFFTAADGARGLEFRWENSEGAFTLVASVTLKNGRSVWRASVVNKNAERGIHTLEYPVLGSLIEPGKGDVLLPGGHFGAALLKNNRKANRFRYPGANMPCAFAAAMREGEGVYFGAQDPRHCLKFFSLRPDQTFSFGQHPEPMCQPGVGMETAYPVVLEPFSGNWYRAADIHREYLKHSGQLPDELRLSRRPLPKEYKEAGLFFSSWGAVTATYVRQAGRFFKTPVVSMWSHWNAHPYDRHYPDLFPALKRFGEEVAVYKMAGHVPMPYTNGRCACLESPYFTSPEGAAGRVRTLTGGDVTDFKYKGTNPPKYDNGEPGRAVVMCPGTALWEKTLTDICARLAGEYKVPCIYIDQIGAAVGHLCFAPGHRHQPGGAASFTKNYLKIIESVRRACGDSAQKRIPLTTEHGGDAWLGAFDGFILQWWVAYKHAECVPLMPYLYSGYVLSFSDLAHGVVQDADAYAMIQGRFFLWGVMPHVHQREFEGETYPGGNPRESAARHAYLRELVGARSGAKEFMIYGSFLGELEPSVPIPSLTAEWKHIQKRKHISASVTLPAVQASLWRSEAGKIGVAVVNYSTRPCRFKSEGKYRIDVTMPGRSARFIRL